MVPLQKTSGKGPVGLDEIRPIVVRSHIAKIMEKAILAKIKEEAPQLLESRMYQTGFKESKSTAIHASSPPSGSEPESPMKTRAG